MKHVKLFEAFIDDLNEAKMDLFPEYNNGLDTSTYTKELKKSISKVKEISQYNEMDSTSSFHLKSEPGTAEMDLTKEIQKALKGFDDNLDLDNITNNIGQPNMTSPNDLGKGIISYKIPKKVDWWTLKRASGPEKPSQETKVTSDIISSLLDKMAGVSTTQDQLADITWTSLNDFLSAAEDHMSTTNYKKFYKEVKKKYPKMA